MKKKNEKIEKILNNWVYDIIGNSKIRIILGFTLKFPNKLIIYTNYPGILIGKAGCCIDDLRIRLKNEGYKKKIDFRELGCGYFRYCK